MFLGNKSYREWHFLIGVYINLNAPASKMLDHDWIEPTGFPKLKFSYTESETEMFMLTINMRAHKKLTSLGILDFFLSFGYSLRYISQNIKGYRGWQIDLSSGTIYDIQGNEQALTYDIFYHYGA